MLIKDLLSTHDFHDSLLTNVIVQENQLELTIDYCYWMQNGYQETEPETGIIYLCFDDISEYNGPVGEIDDYSILEVEYSNTVLTFLLLDDFNNKSHTLYFHSQSNSVEIKR